MTHRIIGNNWEISIFHFAVKSSGPTTDFGYDLNIRDISLGQGHDTPLDKTFGQGHEAALGDGQ